MEENEVTIIADLKVYTEPRMNPFRAAYLNEIAICYKFKELDQWSGVDKAGLDAYGVPDIPVDRINRGLDTINGIDENTGGKVDVVGFESGDDRVAKILGMVCEHVEIDADIAEPEMLAFDALKDVGLGVMKVGYDYEKRSIFVDYVNTEDFAWSRSKNRNLEDITWCWEHQVMSWEDAAILFPQKAAEIKSLKTLAKSEWEKIRQDSGTNVTAQSRDYGSGSDGTSLHPDQVNIYEFWVKKVVPFKKIARLSPEGMGEIVKADASYEPVEGEDDLGGGIDVQWWQSVVVSGENFADGILARHAQSEFPWHPYVAMIAEKKKNGQPRGYIEIVKPHQIRLNLAWAQKVAFNNKSIKSPLMLEGPGVTPDVVENATFQSKIGAVFVVPTGVKATPVQPASLNLQAVEEAAAAKQDMDFAAAATEGALMGQAASGDSGVKLSMMQNAAITPLNKWVKAKHRAKKILWKKVIDIIIAKFSVAEIARVVGQQRFLMLSGYTIQNGQLVPLMADEEGKPLPPPIEWPLDNSTARYDIVIQNQSASDFNKQQAFNATEALVGGGVPLTDEFRIKQSPMKNVQDALEANKAARQDIIKALTVQIQMLTQQNKELSKSSTQAANGKEGARESQAGKRSMLGGQNSMGIGQ